MAKSLHIGHGARACCLTFIHSIAQACIFSRAAGGSFGGGVDVSSGGSSESAGLAAPS